CPIDPIDHGQSEVFLVLELVIERPAGVARLAGHPLEDQVAVAVAGQDPRGSWFHLGRISTPIDSGQEGAADKLPIPGKHEASLAGRLPDDLGDTAADLHFDSLPFTPLYRTHGEFAAE